MRMTTTGGCGLMLALVLLLQACGGDDGGPDDAAVATTRAEATTSTQVTTSTTSPPTTTTTVTATTQRTTTTADAGPSGGLCPTQVTSRIGRPVAVIAPASVSCAEATAVVDRYFNDPSLELGGSSGYAEFDGWGCSTTSGTGTEVTGHIGWCEDGADRAIEMRVPGR